MDRGLWFRTTNPNACVFSYATPSSPDELTIYANGQISFDGDVILEARDVGQLDGGWHHMRVSRWLDGDVRRFIDGVYAGQRNLTTQVTLESPGFLVIGNDQDGFGSGLQASEALNGAVDEIRVWSEQLFASYLDDQYMRPADPTDPNLVAYYRCEQLQNLGVISASAVDDLEDFSGNGNHIDVQGGFSPTDMIDHGTNYIIDFGFTGPTRFVEYDAVVDGSITTTLGETLAPATSGEPAGAFVRVEDLICEVSVNGSAPIYDEVSLTPGDQIVIDVDSPLGSHDFITTPLLLAQELPTGVPPVSLLTFPEVRLGFVGVTPEPFVVAAADLMAPLSINVVATAPPGASGSSLVLQPFALGSMTANGVFAVGNVVVLNL